jgi:hypothetical protein
MDVTVREMASQGDSPLHARVAHKEGGDETVRCSDAEWRLMDRTFGNPDWYFTSRAGYPLLMVAMERLDSGEFDTLYNRNEPLYIASQEISSRSRCPIHLAWKTVVLAVRATIEQAQDGDCYVTDLADLFVAAYEHSRHDSSAWNDVPWACREFPTPFAYIMSGICLDLYFLSKDAMRKAGGGQQPPNQVAQSIGMTWSRCMMYLTDNDDHVPASFRVGLLRDYFARLLDVRDECDGQHDSTPAPARLGTRCNSVPSRACVHCEMIVSVSSLCASFTVWTLENPTS